MSGGLLAYSGLVTKTRAMHGGLLSREDIVRLSEYETVEEIIAFLREYGSYAPIYQSHEEIAHRAQVEAVLGDSLYADYGKLYRFADKEQRRGLEIIFLRYETDVIKSCLERVVSGGDVANYAYLNLFFAKHASFDTAALAAAGSVTELMTALSGTPYAPFLQRLFDNPGMVYADYATQLDILYYKMAWQRIEKLADKRMKEIYRRILGTEIDWQNIMWIYRSKRFYGRGETEIYADMIPIRCRLKKTEAAALLATENLDEFVAILGKTAYFTEKDAVVKLGDEITFREMMERTYDKVLRKYPMSIASILRYLYDKENEIDMLTMILEGVRYRIPAREIQELVLPTGNSV